MMGWFKPKKELDPAEELTAQRISDWVLAVQRKLADWLNGRFSEMKQRNIVLLFLSAGICFGGYCLWLLLSVFR